MYFDVASQRETVLVEEHSAEALREYFEAQCVSFLQWAEAELAHRDARDASLATLEFPACLVSRGAAKAGRRRLPRGEEWAMPDGAGPHGHRQDHRHNLPRAEGDAHGTRRQAVLPRGEDVRSRPRARFACPSARARTRYTVARARAGGAGQGLRVPAERLLRRFVPARERVLRSAPRRA